MASRTGILASATLESLRRSLGLFTNLGERSRAGCELAFTYQESGQTAAAATQFADAQNLKPSPDRPHERRGAPLPAGACAYWMSSTPFGPQARGEMSRIVDARRSAWAKTGVGLSGDRQYDLQELAMMVSESEAGEIDWGDGPRFTR